MKTMFKTQIGGKGRPDDRIFVDVDNRYSVAIIAQKHGISIEVYPMTDDRQRVGGKDAELWCEPYETFHVDDGEVEHCSD